MFRTVPGGHVERIEVRLNAIYLVAIFDPNIGWDVCEDRFHTLAVTIGHHVNLQLRPVVLPVLPQSL